MTSRDEEGFVASRSPSDAEPAGKPEVVDVAVPELENLETPEGSDRRSFMMRINNLAEGFLDMTIGRPHNS